MNDAGRLVLSVFPGIDLFGLAFQEEWPELCIVRGPDLIFGSLHDVCTFHPPAGLWFGVIGGPPCQCFSRLRHLNPKAGERHGNMIPEFERIVEEARPVWYVMENVPEAPVPQVRGYWPAHSLLLNNRYFGGEQQRRRRFSFGVRQDCAPHALELDVSSDLVLLEAPLVEHAFFGGTAAVRPPAVLAGHGDGPAHRARGLTSRTVGEMCRLQGVSADFLDGTPFTVHGKKQMVGNGVPLALGRAIAAAVRRAMEGV